MQFLRRADSKLGLDARTKHSNYDNKAVVCIPFLAVSVTLCMRTPCPTARKLLLPEPSQKPVIDCGGTLGEPTACSSWGLRLLQNLAVPNFDS